VSGFSLGGSRFSIRQTAPDGGRAPNRHQQPCFRPAVPYGGAVVWRVLTFIPATAVAIALVGCVSEPEVKPKGRTVVPIHAGSNRVKLSVHLLDEVVVQLPPVAAPGNQWTIVYNDARYLKPLGTIQPDKDGGYQMSLLAVHQGRRALRLFALPPTGRERVPSQTYELLFEIE
jgi:hypothetical protein